MLVLCLSIVLISCLGEMGEYKKRVCDINKNKGQCDSFAGSGCNM